ncbi:unnamed protein product [Auanema sp. JU1783]|nr:unnamed protein product [Auanema sp. JU1783]
MDCGLWCVFSERRRHVERLWRRRLLVTSDERRARRRFLRLMRGFDAEDVEVIRKAVESGGVIAKACAPGPPMDERPDDDMPEEDSGLIPQIDRPMSMPYLCCKLWRWKDLQVDAALHRLEALPWCRFGRVTINNATVSCCNPYHYALWIRPETSCADDESSVDDLVVGGPHSSAYHTTTTTLPSMTSTAARRRSQAHASTLTTNPLSNGHLQYRTHMASTMHYHQRPTDIDIQPLTVTNSIGNANELPDHAPPSVPASTPPEPPDSPPCSSNRSSPSHNFLHQQSSAWGRLTRYERKEKVAETVQLTGQFAAVGILSNSVHDAQAICSDWDTRNEVSFALIRQAEPLGSDGPEDVWLYNSGTRPLFICVTPSPSSRADTLRRLSPGYCIRVHRGEPSSSAPASERTHHHHRRHSRDPALLHGNLIISVGKGWGPNYSRLYVTDIPCRYEITFIS